MKNDEALRYRNNNDLNSEQKSELVKTALSKLETNKICSK